MFSVLAPVTSQSIVSWYRILTRTGRPFPSPIFAANLLINGEYYLACETSCTLSSVALEEIFRVWEYIPYDVISYLSLGLGISLGKPTLNWGMKFERMDSWDPLVKDNMDFLSLNILRMTAYFVRLLREDLRKDAIEWNYGNVGSQVFVAWHILGTKSTDSDPFFHVHFSCGSPIQNHWTEIVKMH